MVLEFRQNRLDNKSLGRIDKIIGKVLPSYIKGDLEDFLQYLRKNQVDLQKKKNERVLIVY